MSYIFADDYEFDPPRYELRYAGKLVKLEPPHSTGFSGDVLSPLRCS
jgi:hypothetical protein